MTAPAGEHPGAERRKAASKAPSGGPGEPDSGDASSRLAVSGLRITTRPSRGRPGVDVVDEVSFTVAPGQVLGLVGESGSGKTTVALALLGHVRRGLAIDRGHVLIDGQDIVGLPSRALQPLRGRTVAYVPQDPASALNPVLKIGTQLREVLAAHDDEPGAAADRLAQVLGEAGLDAGHHFLDQYPHQLSGGQQQRVAIAMAFACRPRLIVADEPTTGLDVTTQRRVLDTIRGMCRSYQVAAVYISHDLAVVAEIADHVAVMYAGRLVETGPARDVFAAPAHPYSRGLLRAVPSLDRSHVLHGLPGQPPRPGSRPPGCFFQPRCEFAVPACAEEQPPPLTVSASGHRAWCLRATQVVSLTGSAAVPRQRPAESATGPTLRISGLSASYDRSRVLADVTLTVPAQRCVAVVGTSGSGKTTLARCVVGLHRNWTGAVEFSGAALPAGVRGRTREQLRGIQYVSQNPYSSLNPRHTIGQIISQPLAHFDRLGAAELRERTIGALTAAALSESFLDRYPDQLSGGERQRVALARAIIVEPALLVCDEVTSALDVSVQAAIVELLRRLQAERGLSLLFITHNLPLVRSIADEVVVISAGTIREHGPVAEVLASPRDAYTAQLLADVPRLVTAPTSPE